MACVFDCGVRKRKPLAGESARGEELWCGALERVSESESVG